ncbi:CCA tRNA nucleotidyltransferase [Desulfosporosinus sp. Sb-LF]|uniref:CCA tRNA nucleotidyltransferase n=1 Tax=Desulfosporosinus sp. Sb-LF TaxID=2560027 RepID=UPI00107F970B|nr:CCA tRNA nucleotidyltransferase [Desulfosporosinus sp. Sb-LF]TGE32059.1 CCA tRNA nucleotidyltransferase [Desulfosporosinus sp. Sb-LF]
MIGTLFHQEILKRLSVLSPVYIVGGAVRDAQLGIPSKDVDAVIALPIQEIDRQLSEWGYMPHVIGAHQQTVSLFLGTERVDIVTFNGEVEKDALRRDFTLNAIYQEVGTGEIKDPLGGLKDLHNRQLKACGHAKERFYEDPIRILRLIRLAVRYNFEIERETWLAAIEQILLLRTVSAERITEELGRILILDEVDKALGLLDDLGYFETYIPELARLKGLVQNRYHTKDAWEHTRHVVKNTPSHVLLRLAALFHDMGKWETASRECYAWGTIYPSPQGYKIDDFKLIGQNLERWATKDVEVHGGRLDNYPETIVAKRIKLARPTPNNHFEWVPEGKRHFLQHEKESARLVRELLPRFRWAMVLPGGSRGERELHFLVGHHMLGTLTFMNELRGEVEQAKISDKARLFAWKIGWDGQYFNTQRVENLLVLWKADFLGGKQDAEKNVERFDRVQGKIRNACALLTEKANQLDWRYFTEFVRNKGLEGERYGRFKEQVRKRVMMSVKYSLTNTQFLEQEYAFFLNNKR